MISIEIKLIYVTEKYKNYSYFILNPWYTENINYFFTNNNLKISYFKEFCGTDYSLKAS